MALDPGPDPEVKRSSLRRWAPAMIAVVILAGIALVVLLGRPNESLLVVDGWEIGPEQNCAQLELPQPRCDALVARVVASIPTPAGATVTRISLHPVERFLPDKTQLILQVMSGGRPSGVVLVEFSNGARAARPFGCIGVNPPGPESDPLCPTGRPG